MAPRQKLQTLFEAIAGVEKVYFQPPPSSEMKYPCIIYERDASDKRYADNVSYSIIRQYQVTVIDRNPDSTIADVVEVLPMCTLNRFFVTDGLNHFVFNLYF